jgi:hypothetical protein
MLIIAIPKSASTSLLKTISNLHNIEGHQLLFKDRVIPDEYPHMGKFHSDLRELKLTDLSTFFDNNRIYKQHIPPTKNNLNLLKNNKKVILLREPNDVVLAYYRADKKLLHEKRQEFKNDHSPEEWLLTATKIGLLRELNDFYDKWIKIDSDKLLIKYEDLLFDPQQVINSIESYFELKRTDHKIILAKERYSRDNWLYTMPRVIKKYLLKKIDGILI